MKKVPNTIPILLNVILLNKEEFRACADIQISHTATTEVKKRTKGSFWNQRNSNSIERTSERRKDDKDFSMKSAKPDSYRYSLKGKNSNSYSFFSFDISSNSDDDSVASASENKMKEKRILNKNR